MKRRTDKYGAIDAPPLAFVRALPRRLDAPPPIVLDAPETPRERTARLTLARSRFIADQHNGGEPCGE